jgi:hypothetical protein
MMGLVEPFNIDDDGELDNLSPQECFVLGVEWQILYERLKAGGELDQPVHAVNAPRVAAMFERHGRTPTLFRSMEGWIRLRVPAIDSPPPLTLEAAIAAAKVDRPFIDTTSFQLGFEAARRAAQ